MKNTTTLGQLILNLIFILISLLYILPILLLVSISFSSEASIMEFGYSLIPAKIDLTAYKMIFRSPDTLITAYKTTIIFTLVTTLLSVIIMAMAAYPLSRSNCKFKKAFSIFMLITMLFNGGLVPHYIINTRYLHLGNTIWIYILPFLVSAWYIIIIRTFFQGLPEGLVEAAKIDGASEMRILFQIMLPLSTPVLATIAFMQFLGKWGDWNTTLIYIRDPNLYSLQYLLQSILREAEFLNKVSADGSGLFDYTEAPIESMRYAMAILAAGPAMFVFPFFQKYLTKGLTVGAVKG